MYVLGIGCESDRPDGRRWGWGGGIEESDLIGYDPGIEVGAEGDAVEAPPLAGQGESGPWGPEVGVGVPRCGSTDDLSTPLWGVVGTRAPYTRAVGIEEDEVEGEWDTGEFVVYDQFQIGGRRCLGPEYRVVPDETMISAEEGRPGDRGIGCYEWLSGEVPDIGRDLGVGTGSLDHRDLGLVG